MSSIQQQAYVTSAVKFVLAAVILGGCYGYLTLGHDQIGMFSGAFSGAVIGIIGFPSDVLMSLGPLGRRLNRLPFLLTFLIKSTWYIWVIGFAFRLSAVFLSPSEAGGEAFLAPSRTENMTAILASLAMNFVFSVEHLLGPGVLPKFLTGRYHSPVLEERVFLFLDLQGSTAIAEQIGPLAFHRLLNRFIADVTVPLMRYGGEIYKYVGDEIIVSWPIESGLSKARCLTACIEARKRLDSQAAFYDRDFMIKPQFRAGLHCGVAVTGEMGSIRVEIVYLGDVVNTTARIQQECRPNNRWLLISKALHDRLHLPEKVRAEGIGEISLRGKKEAMELFAIETVADDPNTQQPI